MAEKREKATFSRAIRSPGDRQYLVTTTGAGLHGHGAAEYRGDERWTTAERPPALWR